MWEIGPANNTNRCCGLSKHRLPHAKKYPQLFALVKCVLSLSHVNSAPESGFSINKSMLEVHGHSLGEDTLEALRVVKDAIVNSGSVLNIPITHMLIMSVKNSYQKYQADLEAKRKLK